jgi:hypothetical protein
VTLKVFDDFDTGDCNAFAEAVNDPGNAAPLS